ncbi:class III lanthionine synthetase LanKC [Streptomyces sp. PTM05]|uniref:Class III lanthionine synthetase LanKC n=1 Tax=Streptantibioticus parmotrematis TaxID=2873249 RepID=A0ABS7QQD1_9ACTN|nr:class III lanthionine synthetase LanKC [Streptantibioticus parmotrematis]MBY8885398.1 class III lanthionine synthetase LanKC [Streptantibioticus parmotrematis]
MFAYWLTLADREFYVPVERAPDPGEGYAPHDVPAGWTGTREGVWAYWRPDGVVLPDQGWKVHVSTTRERLAFTLDTVAAACFAEGVVFKHLAAPLFYGAFHHKHASRAQAGKFCALYPPDVATARRLMERLARELKGESGPYVLTDRRFGDSEVVHYRYGAYRSRKRVQADGTSVHLVRDGHGEDQVDVRSTEFVLPPGIEDPFAPPPQPHTGPVLLDGRFQVTEVIRHSNGGGTYRATDTSTGAQVFVKEARPHNGLIGDGTESRDRLRREWQILRRVHAAAPGLCPEPVAHFTVWDHDFLVTEFVPGTGFLKWVAANTTVGWLDMEPERHAAYFADVERVLSLLGADLRRLHEIGLRFGDVSHNNVLVQGDLTVRLIDFETVTERDQPPSPLGTPGYTPPPKVAESGVDPDDYGFAGLALCALFPLHQPLERDPRGRLELYRRDVARDTPVPESLWRQATRHHGRGQGDLGPSAYELPTAADLDERPEQALTRLREGLTAGLLAMARPDGPDWVFPPSPRAYSFNTLCVEHGTAGVVYALRRSGTDVPDAVLDRLRNDALSRVGELTPGLQTGSAGIAWVLDESGLREEAGHLLGAALAHPLADASAQLATGAAGIGLAHLALRDGHDGALEAAARIGDAILRDDGAAALAGAGVPGLAAGLSGTALFLHSLGAVTGEERYTRAAVRLVHAELDKATGDGDGPEGLRFSDGTRIMPHLATGAAGVATALGRLAADGDERSALALPGVLRVCRLTCSMEPGLYAGVAGWAYALAEHAELTGRDADRRAALRVATGLAKYAVRHPTGLRVLGSLQTRYQADLASGGAGVLLALARVLDGPTASLFTVPPPTAQAPSADTHRAAVAAVAAV